MAGGIGSRFWPMSTPDCPKQFIDVLGTGKTLLQMTVDRFGDLIPAQNVWVVTSASYKGLVQEQLPGIPESNILLEPCMRNTAPCIAYVTWKIKQQDPQANLVVSPADHIVLDVNEFQYKIKEALDFTENDGNILTLGMKPSRPDTGYGYIQQSESVADDSIRKVNAFKEKPNLEMAQYYLAEGGYFWNAGIFCWNVKTIEKAFREFEPDMAAIFDGLNNVYFTGQEQKVINSQFPQCKSISIDYAVMERVASTQTSDLSLYVLPADFGWSDLGTWGSLYSQISDEANRNAIVGDQVKLIDSSECIVHVPEGKRVVVQGLDGYIIAEKNNTLLICKMAEEQRIKEFSLF